MKLRGIHIRAKNASSDISLDLMDNEGKLVEQCLLRGNLLSGKSLICHLVSSSWSSSILSHSNLDLGLDIEMVRVDFVVGSEIVSVHIRNGLIEPSSLLAKAGDVCIGDRAHVHGGVLYYSSLRENYMEYVNAEYHGSGAINRCLPIIYDLQMKDIKDSIILIDDWDLGLDAASAKLFYTFISSHSHSGGNQLILTSSSAKPGYIADRSCFELSGGSDIISECLKVMGSVAVGE